MEAGHSANRRKVMVLESTHRDESFRSFTKRHRDPQEGVIGGPRLFPLAGVGMMPGMGLVFEIYSNHQ